MEAYNFWVALPYYPGVMAGLLGFCAVRAAARAADNSLAGTVRGAAGVRWAVLQTLAVYFGGFALLITAFLLLIEIVC